MNDVLTLTQFRHRIRLLKSNLLKTFFGGESEAISLSAQDLNWLKSLPESFYQKFNKENVYEIFSALEKTSDNLPILTMYLAFEPDEITLSQIGPVARKTFNLPLLLLDIKVDPNLIAGTALSWKGVYRDYSLRTKIEEKKTEISNGFKRFLR